MRYEDYDNEIMCENDIEKYKKFFEEDIERKQKELLEFIERAEKRVEWINSCIINKTYQILGGTYKNGKNKEIMLIIRFPDGTQKNERYKFKYVSDMREKLNELKLKYNGVDWSNFDEKIK